MPGDPKQEAAYRAADLRLFETSHFSDVLVTCGPRSWNLHRNILCTRSVWFEKAIAGSYVGAQQMAQGADFDGTIRIHEQDPAAVEVCLKYIYGGVAAIDMENETRLRGTFKFCSELYRTADFFLLEPLLPVVRHHLGAYCDEKVKWLFTRGNTDEYQMAKIYWRMRNRDNVDEFRPNFPDWIEDLKNAIRDVEQWKTPVIRAMLLEFVWASALHKDNVWLYPITIYHWLNENARGFRDEMRYYCNPFSSGYIRRLGITPRWTPAPCRTTIPTRGVNTCVRCRKGIPTTRKDQEDYGVLQDAFNTSHGIQTRAWCKECAAEVKYPWREDGYL